MSHWRAKVMPLADWALFQERYTELFMGLGGDHRMALFIQRKQGDDQETVLIPSFNSQFVEVLSPGGWEDHEHPTGSDISLLVGNASAPEDINVSLGL